MSLVFGQPERVMRAIWAAQMADPAERELAQEYGIGYGEFLRVHDGADVVGVAVDGRLAGGMFFFRGQAHIGILPSYRGRWARDLRAMLDFGFRRHGVPLRTRVYAKNKEALEFVEHVGCLRTRAQGLYVEYDIFPKRLSHVLNH